MKIPLLNPFKRYSEKVGQPPGTLIYLGEEPTEPVRITIIDYDETHYEEEEVQTVEECVPFIDTETVSKNGFKFLITDCSTAGIKLSELIVK